MTWLEFKSKTEKLGIKDEDDIWYKDISFNEEFKLERDKNCHVVYKLGSNIFTIREIEYENLPNKST